MAKKEGEFHFCSNQCLTNYKHPGFCPECVAETGDEPAGNTRTIRGIGLRLYGNKASCPTCYSTIRRKFFCVVFIPVIPFKRYRVKYTAPTRYLSREIKPEQMRQSELRTQSEIRKG